MFRLAFEHFPRIVQHPFGLVRGEFGAEDNEQPPPSHTERDQIAQLTKERDELKAKVTEVERERDEARAELDRLRSQGAANKS